MSSRSNRLDEVLGGADAKARAPRSSSIEYDHDRAARSRGVALQTRETPIVERG
jgi:hypothetical protein